ncbi:MAG: outer membrane protein assembly factor BamE [Chromatiales bacterium]|nr:outer membrane protein assembly factor BamE [Chromatiales bacterium]
MKKLLTYLVLGASLAAGGCSTVDKVGSVIPNAMDKLPFVYRLDIQQGNMVDQETVNKLKPGMSKTQVRYVMGTPMLIDTFHEERWDYIYSFRPGGKEREQTRVALFFEDGRLTQIKGDLYPQPAAEIPPAKEEPIVSVPDYEPEEKGVLTRMMEKVGIESGDDELIN